MTTSIKGFKGRFQGGERPSVAFRLDWLAGSLRDQGLFYVSEYQLLGTAMGQDCCLGVLLMWPSWEHLVGQ